MVQFYWLSPVKMHPMHSLAHTPTVLYGHVNLECFPFCIVYYIVTEKYQLTESALLRSVYSESKNISVCLFSNRECDQNISLYQFGALHLKVTLQRQTTKHADWDNMGDSGGTVRYFMKDWVLWVVDR